MSETFKQRSRRHSQETTDSDAPDARMPREEESDKTKRGDRGYLLHAVGISLCLAVLVLTKPEAAVSASSLIEKASNLRGDGTDGTDIQTLKTDIQTLKPYHTWPEGCNWKCYMENNPDLEKNMAAPDEHNAIAHWLLHGVTEKRDCQCKNKTR